MTTVNKFEGLNETQRRGVLKADIEAYLASGGKIEQVPEGVCTWEPEPLSQLARRLISSEDPRYRLEYPPEGLPCNTGHDTDKEG